MAHVDLQVESLALRADDGSDKLNMEKFIMNGAKEIIGVLIQSRLKIRLRTWRPPLEPCKHLIGTRLDWP